MQSDALPTPDPLVTRLVELETLKTWSLIVTLFGDLDGDALTGAQIRAVLGHIGIKPEAIRVALHRLKTDGWIDVTKRGREAVYGLSPMGRRETDAVRGDIYARTVKHPEGWDFVLVRDRHTPGDGIALTRELSVAPRRRNSEEIEMLRLTASEAALPNWVEDALAPKKIQHIASMLVNVLDLTGSMEPHSRDKICLRLLILHHWRRLALRPGTWAQIGLLPNGRLAHCHKRVTEFLEKQPRISGRDIDLASTGV